MVGHAWISSPFTEPSANTTLLLHLLLPSYPRPFRSPQARVLVSIRRDFPACQCKTTIEILTLCASGFPDPSLSSIFGYSRQWRMHGASARVLATLMHKFPSTHSCLSASMTEGFPPSCTFLSTFAYFHALELQYYTVYRDRSASSFSQRTNCQLELRMHVSDTEQGPETSNELRTSTCAVVLCRPSIRKAAGVT